MRSKELLLLLFCEAKNYDYYNFNKIQFLFKRVIYSSYFYFFHERKIATTILFTHVIINFLFISAGLAGY